MAEQTHTPEPWHVDTACFHDGNRFAIIHECEGVSDDEPMCPTIAEVWPADNGQDEADATRIVACVNACKGIDPATIPALLRQRDALLEACKELLDDYAFVLADEYSRKAADDEVCNRASAAIALCTQGETTMTPRFLEIRTPEGTTYIAPDEIAAIYPYRGSDNSEGIKCTVETKSNQMFSSLDDSTTLWERIAVAPDLLAQRDALLEACEKGLAAMETLPDAEGTLSLFSLTMGGQYTKAAEAIRSDLAAIFRAALALISKDNDG